MAQILHVNLVRGSNHEMDILKIEIYFEWEIKVHDHLEVLWDVVTRLKTNQQLFPCILNAKFCRKYKGSARSE